MRAHQHAPPLVVVRSEDASGRVGLRLIGELDLDTVGLLADKLSEFCPPSVIDLSELRFLDLTGLRMLQRAGEDEASTRLVGATGIVRRTIELARVLDAARAGALGLPPASEPTTRIRAELHEATRAANSTPRRAPAPTPAAIRR